ncbi:efflux RND transporter periplasmic adaptor subunit [Celeribacter halophilus]|uniref:efflux RND transporter periplasmic adaptor subunit n=1 Tax=Celeribacter halophilus TaxID=576117 RepID=UPI003A915B5C
MVQPKPEEETQDAQRPAEQNGTATKPPVPALRPAAPEPAGKPRIWLWGALVLLGLGLLGGLSSRLWLGGAVPVVVEIAQNAPVTRVLAVNGRIAAVHSVDVSAVVSGTVVSLPVAEGEQVDANQILAQVDAAEQNAIVRQAMAALDAALVAQQKATEDYDRSLSLGSNVSKTDLEADAFAKQSAIQEVLRLSAFLDQARIALDNYTIRAPVAGTVLELEVETGQAISPSTNLLTLADLNDLVVEADVDESYATQIKVGQKAVLQLAGQTATHEGHVSFVSNRVDEATGGLAVKLRFDTPVAAPVGLTVTTNIIVEDRDAALTVPRTALVDGNEVFVVVDGLAELRPVTVVDWPAARLIATDGLAEGDVVIVDATGITDGQEVEAETP